MFASRMTFFTLTSILLINSAIACSPDGKTGILPENNLHIPETVKTGLTKEQFDSVIDKVVAAYTSIARSYGAELKIDRQWQSGRVNASTFQDEGGRHWHITLYGGFARHPYINEDGFALVICHELAHHIGGAPKKYLGQNFPMWASTEGQADYFATLKCLRKVFAKDDNLAVVKKLNPPEKVIQECKLSFQDPTESALCIRNSMAGLAVANVNADTLGIALTKFETPDETEVEETLESHPAPQCRLDTYFQGALCNVKPSVRVSQRNEISGTCHPSLGYAYGLRPACWFMPSEWR